MVAPRTVLLVASLGVFMAFVDATIVNIAFPDIQRSFPGSSISGLSWIFNAYNIVFAALLVAAGRAADLLGRKRMFEKGLWLFTLASVLCGWLRRRPSCSSPRACCKPSAPPSWSRRRSRW